MEEYEEEEIWEILKEITYGSKEIDFPQELNKLQDKLSKIREEEWKSITELQIS